MTLFYGWGIVGVGREYFGARIMGAVFGAVSTVATLGMRLGPVATPSPAH